VVAEAATGQQAVRESTLHHPEVMVMDLAMPGLNGIEATASPYAPTRRLGCWC
jgi:CheY-like chemotaxis protein